MKLFLALMLLASPAWGQGACGDPCTTPNNALGLKKPAITSYLPTVVISTVAPGYSVWFDASLSTSSDTAGTMPSVVGGSVLRWNIRDGSATGAHVTQAAGTLHPTLRVTGPGSGFRALQGPIDSTFVDSSNIAAGGTIALDGSAFTAFAVVKWAAATDTSAWGTSMMFGAEQRSIPEIAAYDNSGNLPSKAGNFSGTFVIVTTMLFAGTGYVGVSDTRSANLGASVGFSMPADAPLSIMSGLGGRFLDGYIAALVIYPTALSESDRMITERYLGSLYGITLPY